MSHIYVTHICHTYMSHIYDLYKSYMCVIYVWHIYPCGLTVSPQGCIVWYVWHIYPCRLSVSCYMSYIAYVTFVICHTYHMSHIYPPLCGYIVSPQGYICHTYMKSRIWLVHRGMSSQRCVTYIPLQAKCVLLYVIHIICHIYVTCYMCDMAPFGIAHVFSNYMADG